MHFGVREADIQTEMDDNIGQESIMHVSGAHTDADDRRLEEKVPHRRMVT